MTPGDVTKSDALVIARLYVRIIRDPFHANRLPAPAQATPQLGEKRVRQDGVPSVPVLGKPNVRAPGPDVDVAPLKEALKIAGGHLAFGLCYHKIGLTEALETRACTNALYVTIWGKFLALPDLLAVIIQDANQGEALWAVAGSEVAVVARGGCHIGCQIRAAPLGKGVVDCVL